MPEKINLTEKHQPFKPNQFKVRVDALPKHQHIQQNAIDLVDESTWYKYTLKCEHWVLSKVRIRVGQNYSFREHYIRCPQAKHEPLEWIAIIRMEAVTDDFVRDVQSVNAYVLPNRILRVDGHTGDRVHNSGNPFPYVPKSSDRQYW